MKPNLSLKKACDKAIKLLLVNDLTASQKEKIVHFIERDFENYNCCVLYAIDSEFKNLLASENLDIGKKEVIISQNCTVRYTDDFVAAPMEV